MNKYHKIHTIFKRDKNKKIIFEDWSKPEFKFLSKNNWTWCEKIDGMNMRIELNPNEKPIFEGRTNNALIPPKLTNWIIENLDPSKISVQHQLILYGEGFGKNITKRGALYQEEHSFILFDVWCNGLWLQRNNIEDVAQHLNIPVVSKLGEGNLYEMIDFIKSRPKSIIGSGKAEIEGVVAKPEIELFNRMNKRIITKLKCSDFD